MGKDSFKSFKKACKKDLNSKEPLKVHIYETARQEAKQHFGFDHDHKIREFFAELDEKHFHFYKEDKLEKVVWGLPIGTPFSVFYFTYSEPKDGYIAILKFAEKEIWLLKSCKKNETNMFSNNPFSILLERVNKE